MHDAPPSPEPLDHIVVQGAREHNLKGIDLSIPRDALTVITGLSGSGKSSLAFDTIYQEGQRRFMESLSAYARQFLGKMDKPRVDGVDGLSPTLSIDQKTVNRNPRSTVGTITEILDHLRLLMARLGTPRCPECQRPIRTSSPGQIADGLLRDHPGARLHVLAPIVQDRKGEYRKELKEALAQGFIRARVDGELRSLEEEFALARYEKHTIELVMDRLRARPDDRSRLVEAIERAVGLCGELVSFLVEDEGEPRHFLVSATRSCPDHGISIPELEPRLFSFNAPQGMCPECSGIGWLEDFDLELLVDPDAPPARALRAFEKDDRLPFSSLTRDTVEEVARKLGIPPDAPLRDADETQRYRLIHGADIQYRVVREQDGRKTSSTKTWAGLLPIVRHVWHFTHLPRLGRYRRRVSCPSCQGLRLNPVARAVTFRDRVITDLTSMTVRDARAFFDGLALAPEEERIGRPIVRELSSRLGFLDQVGLGYLTIDRSADTLSGGEAQRIRLASQVGAGLQGVTYVLDEPSIGLHGRDQARLLDALATLRDKGNTVLVVEHDAATMARADYLVEIGPGAGHEGGLLTASGTPRRFLRSNALTARYLRGDERIPLPARRRSGNGKTLVLEGACAHNLKDVTLRLPLGTLTVVTGVSGSGKSTLVDLTLHRALAGALHGATDLPGEHTALGGLEHVDKVVRIDQAPIGRTPRSNPATYTGAFTPIRDLFAQVPEARARGYAKGRFSFNVAGGRCEECQGAGVMTVEMQFLSDVEVPCEACGGKRFNAETLEVRYRGRTITDVLDMTVADAAAFFANHRGIRRILETLVDVGMGYVALGQPSTTLSGGEAQRIKLATELSRPSTGRTLYILDEPTTGLHMADVGRLLHALQRLVDAGNTVLVIEHNTDVVKVADHVVDLGPEGGEAGGWITGAGTPEDIARQDTPTGRILAEVLAFEQALDAAPALAGERPLAFDVRPTRRRRRQQAPTISLRGVQTHNLDNLDVDIPQGRLTVITGPSGSGKTSLAFDTIFAEGQRRYVESLSTYARRFLGRMGRAPVDRVEGLAPAIAIDQKNRGHNPRSTVATVTEIYDQMRLLYARIGRPHCPACGRELVPRSPTAAARHLAMEAAGAGWLLADAPADLSLAQLRQDGFARCWDGQEHDIDDLLARDPDATIGTRKLVVDRLDPARSPADRLAESIAVAYGYGGGRACFVARGRGRSLPAGGCDGDCATCDLLITRDAVCPEHGRVLPDELTPRHFSFNSHVGACPDCTGLGRRVEVDPDLLLPRPDQPLDQAVDGRLGNVVLRSARSRALLEAVLAHFHTTPDTPVRAWSPALRQAVLYGLDQDLDIAWRRQWGRSVTDVSEQRRWSGLVKVVEGWSGRADWLIRERTCTTCGGGRLAPAMLAVTVGGLNIAQATAMTVGEGRRHWSSLSLARNDATIAEQPVAELMGRLRFLDDVGLGYLTLDRAADSLSGGEAQRIRLATQLGSRLTGTIYVLDEPTVGLHPRDTRRLLGTLTGLRDLGNTLVVVEHDPQVMLAADHLLDLGPGAGELGGRITAQGAPAEVARSGSLTGEYLAGTRRLPRPSLRRQPQGWITSPASSLHNLKDVAAHLPRGALTVVTGVSGSGKSTLVMDVFAPWLQERLKAGGRRHAEGPHRLVLVEQQAPGGSLRSTPATYADLLNPIRELFAQAPLARERGWTATRFSFNSPQGGRCVHCEGRGAVLVEMHFLSDVWVPCEHCGGRRFGRETLEVRWKGHSIADVLEASVDSARELFAHQRRLARALDALSDVGLGYLRLGQPVTQLSGGELQRLHLARELIGRPQETCYLLDEPTTGLHLSDVDKLLAVLHRLVDAGHMVVVIEHHLEVIANADHVIDLGPEGGEAGGSVVVTGTPEQVRAHPDSRTGEALRAAGF